MEKMTISLALIASFCIGQSLEASLNKLGEDPYIEEDAASLEDNFAGDEPECPELPACHYFKKLCWTTTHSLYDFVIRHCHKSCKLC